MPVHRSSLEAVDWTSRDDAERALRVFERLLYGWDPAHLDQFRRSLAQDGYVLDDERQIRPVGPRLPEGSLARLRDATAIREQLDRIQRAIPDDPALAVGCAKELIESTAKVVLVERGLTVDERADLPRLVREAQDAVTGQVLKIT